MAILTYFVDNRSISTADESATSKISVDSVRQIMERICNAKHRKTTRKAYIGMWRKFNKFVIRLDKIPPTWEERINLYVAYVADKGVKSATIRSYISGIKSVLADDGCILDHNLLKFTALTKGCRLLNDRVKTRLPIKIGLLELLLDKIEQKFMLSSANPQPFLCLLYQCIFILAYYGLLRVGELTMGQHPVRARDVHIADNKNKIMLVLFTSKTHGLESPPQQIKIWADAIKNIRYDPFKLVSLYSIARGGYRNNKEPFFIFSDASPVKPRNVRSVLRWTLRKLGLKAKLYDTHSFRIGRASDLMKEGYTLAQIKHLGRWKSNVVFKYLRE